MAKKKRVLFIIAPKDFRGDELTIPKQKLEEEGIETVVASTTKDRVTGLLGSQIEPDLLVSEANPDDYDYIVVVGGTGATKLANNVEVLKLVSKAKNVGAICLGTVVAAKAGVLDGKDATTFETPETLKTLKMCGAHYVEEDVVIDGTTITASGPDATREFAMKLVKLVKNL